MVDNRVFQRIWKKYCKSGDGAWMECGGKAKAEYRKYLKKRDYLIKMQL